ncbi:MAG TPA: helix-turn-helix domain-containing protein [Solirubrobacterales bacterium]
MQTGIGTTLREARNRRKIELPEVEAAIKIRTRYLRAMENEEWGVLPGGAYTRSFIRTYGSYLGLDGDRLAEDFKRSEADGGPAGDGALGVEPIPGARSRSRSRVPGWVWIAMVSAALVAIMVGVGLAGGGDDGSQAPKPTEREAAQGRTGGAAAQPVAPPGVALELEAKGEVWVCLLGSSGQPLIEGEILEPGAVEGPFRSDGFAVAFGNGEVTLRIDGREAETPATSSPIGFAIDPEGQLRELEEGQRPDCE